MHGDIRALPSRPVAHGVIFSMLPPHAHRRILLLKENLETGGVHTVSDALAHALEAAGHRCDNQVIRATPLSRLWKAASQADVIIATHNFLPAYVAWLLGQWHRKPVITWFHGPLLEVLDRAHASAAKRRWLRWLYRRLPWLVFVSHQGRDSFMQFMGGDASAHQCLQVIPNPHPAWPAARPAPPPAAPHTVRCGYVGRLSPEKRPELLIDTLTQLPQHYALQITGEGPLERALQHESAVRVPGRIQWQGFQPATPALYQAHHVTLLTSAYEGCPMAVLESLAAGVPCVGVPIPALREMLGSHMPYALAEDHSGSALAQAVLRVMSPPAELLQRDMAEVLAQYTPQRFASAWAHLIEQVTA